MTVYCITIDHPCSNAPLPHVRLPHVIAAPTDSEQNNNTQKTVRKDSPGAQRESVNISLGARERWTHFEMAKVAGGESRSLRCTCRRIERHTFPAIRRVRQID